MKKYIKFEAMFILCIFFQNTLGQVKSYKQYITSKYVNEELEGAKTGEGYWICEVKLKDFNETIVKLLQDEITKLDLSINPDSSKIACAACYSHGVAAYFYRTLQDKKAIEESKRAIQLREQFDDGLLWKSNLNLGIYLRGLDDYSNSIQFLELSKNDQIKKLDQIKPKDLILTYRFLAQNYAKLGEFDKSTDYIERAINVKPITKRDSLGLASSYLDYSNVLIKKTKDTLNLHRVITLTDTCIALLGENTEKIKAINNKAIAYRYLKKYNEALNFYNEALSVNTDKFDLFKARIKGNKGALLTEQKKYNEAISELKASLSDKQAYFKKDKNVYNDNFNYSYATNLVNLAENFEGLGDLQEALNYYHLSIINRTNHFRERDIFKSPIINDDLYVHNNVLLTENLNAKARVAFKIYKKEDDIKYLDLARDTYETAFDFQSRLYDDITTENSRLLQAKTIMPYIENALKVQYEYQKLDKDYKATAFKFMELNKASVLMQGINESQALKKVGIPEETLLREKSLRVQITELEKQKNTLTSVGESEFEEINAKLQLLKDEYDFLITALENEYPAYKNLKYQASDIQLNKVREQLDDKTAILEYFVGDNHIYVLTVQKEQVDFHQIEKPTTWETDINNLLEAIIYNYNNYIPDAYALYQLILEKPLACLNDDVKHLQIIPDAELNQIPFAALLMEPKQSGSVDYAKLNYLVNEFFVSYTYSAKLLLEAQKEKKKVAPNKYVAFLAEDSVKINQHCDQHISIISSGLGGDIYMQNDCTVGNFEAQANQYRIINLIMHGCGELGTLSFNDKDLTDAEIYNIDLSNTQLVNLTACETSVGTLKKGEGVISLSRAFTYAGTPSLVATLWSVSTITTCKITELFFDQIKNGKAVDVALWEAQNEYLNNCLNNPDKTVKNLSAHPNYWAGIIPIGNMEPVIIKK